MIMRKKSDVSLFYSVIELLGGRKIFPFVNSKGLKQSWCWNIYIDIQFFELPFCNLIYKINSCI